MEAFCRLFDHWEFARNAEERIGILERHFRSVPPDDAAWGLWLLMGGRLKRLITPSQLRLWVAELTGLPLWMLEECYNAVGDLGEAAALLLPPVATPHPPRLSELVRERLLPLSTVSEKSKREILRRTWSELDTRQSHIWHKMITGSLRVRHAPALLIQALAHLASVEPSVMGGRLMEEWQPSAADFLNLLRPENAMDAAARAYSFQVMSDLEDAACPGEALRDWFVEWNWGGARAQLIRRAGRAVLWTLSGETVTPKYPEVQEEAQFLPDGTVLDGELLVWGGRGPIPLSELRQRMDEPRREIDRRDSATRVFMAYDLLELEGADWRQRPLHERREVLERVMAGAWEASEAGRNRAEAAMRVQGELFAPGGFRFCMRALRISELLTAGTWAEVAALRTRADMVGVPGVVLKRRGSVYGQAAGPGAWLRWRR